MPILTRVSTVSGQQDNVGVSPADDVLATWLSAGQTYFQVLDEDGDVVGTEFSLAGVPLHATTILANGDILAVTSATQAFRYSQAGVLLDQSAAFGGTAGQTVELAGGNILVTQSTGGQLFGQLLDPALDAVGAPFLIGAAADQRSDVTALAGGGFVVVQRLASAVSAIQVFDANGVPVGAAHPLTGFDPETDLQPLADGGFVFAGARYTPPSGPNDGYYTTLIQTFDADGTARTELLSVGLGFRPTVAVLDGDIYAVGYSIPGPLSALSASYVRVVHSSGVLLGGAERVNNDLNAVIRAVDEDTFVVATGSAVQYWQVDRTNILIGDASNETFDGGGAADRYMFGQDGDDIYLVDSTADRVFEVAGGGNDRVYASVSFTLAADAEVETLSTTLHAGTDAINLTGGATANTMFGNAGANELSGMGGNDLLDGKEGNDKLFGGAGDDILYGRDGDDWLLSGPGVDYMEGGTGDDFYFVESPTVTLVERAGEGNDRVFASLSYVLAPGLSVETISTTLHVGTTAIDLTGNELANLIMGNAGTNVLTGGAGNDVLDGKDGSDTLYGGADNDTLYGGGGDDTLHGGTGTNYFAGGTGSDIYYVDGVGDTVVEAVSEGNDRVYASLSFALAAGSAVETLMAADEAATTAINLTGNELTNFLYGNAGNNILDGRGGVDVMGGKGGDDWYLVDNAGDQVVELSGEGNDRIFASVSYTLSQTAVVETLSTADNAGTGAINLTGNDMANTIFGNAGANVLTGLAGNDVLDGKGGNDTLHGGANNDTLYGGEGNDTLHGGAGINYLAGGTGDDAYVVDGGTDTIAELAGQGADRVYASVSFTLTAGASVEVLSTDFNAGTANLNLTGNELSNTLFGNAGNNILNGGAGKDWLDGKGGQDIFLFNTALNTAAGTPYAALAATANVDLIVGFAFDDKIGLSAT
ncbi:MAG TPA: calcium-binding protein, partial [Allosphingosinicella sp.]|nr:calcium-binding protein [Allosphingosinicella sp.]